MLHIHSLHQWQNHFYSYFLSEYHILRYNFLLQLVVVIDDEMKLLKFKKYEKKPIDEQIHLKYDDKYEIS